MKTPRIWRLTSSSEGRSSMGHQCSRNEFNNINQSALTVRRPGTLSKVIPSSIERSHSSSCHAIVERRKHLAQSGHASRSVESGSSVDPEANKFSKADINTPQDNPTLWTLPAMRESKQR